jgi:hypothetical protein
LDAKVLVLCGSARGSRSFSSQTSRGGAGSERVGSSRRMRLT